MDGVGCDNLAVLVENALRARVGGAAGVISCAEMCWQARAEIGTLGRLQT
eukprot:gene11573-12963_t